VSLLNVSASESKKIERIEQSIETMISLGDNLRSYIEGHALQKESIDLHILLQERIANFEKLYPNISFTLENNNLNISANYDAIARIVDNLLSNAAKYNKINGSVWIRINPSDATLHIDDNGRGIEYPEKIFERFYKEHERGLGIGLHIVKKLCDELKIQIDVTSVPEEGSHFTLNLSALTTTKKERV
jgi:signal transduction histidine kinase